MNVEDTRQQNLASAISDLPLPTGISIQRWEEEYFPGIQELSSIEGWQTPEARPEETRKAWGNSWPALVATRKDGFVVGFIRCITDDHVTTYVGEMLVSKELRGQAVGKALIEAARRLVPNTRFDLLSTESANGFYENVGFRAFPGYRKTW